MAKKEKNKLEEQRSLCEESLIELRVLRDLIQLKSIYDSKTKLGRINRIIELNEELYNKLTQ